MPDSPSVTRWRSLWISDVRLGHPHCQALALADFFDRHHAETLYLVGNTFDARRIKSEASWPRTHNEVFERVLRKSREGTRVVLIPGNLDSFASQFAGMTFGDVDIALDCVHVLADGRRLLVTYSERGDHTPASGRWDALFGDNLYRLARLPGSLRKRLAQWRTAPHPHHGSKLIAAADAQRTAASATHHAARHSVSTLRAETLGLDGVICGASLDAGLDTDDRMLHGMPGSWTTHATLLGENETGELSIVDASTRSIATPLRPRGGIHLPTLPSTLQRGHIRHHP